MRQLRWAMAVWVFWFLGLLVVIGWGVQPDPVALADAQRRELKRQEREVAQHWNAYVRMMNGVMSKLEEGTVDVKLYQMALGEWEDLQKCEGWPYRWVTKDRVGKAGGKK